MIKLKEVNTGEEIILDLENINISNPIERQWDVLEGKKEIELFILGEISRQYKELGLEEPKYYWCRITSYYSPKIGIVNV